MKNVKVYACGCMYAGEDIEQCDPLTFEKVDWLCEKCFAEFLRLRNVYEECTMILRSNNLGE